MTEVQRKRRLAALLMADVAGYSRLVGLDESGTIDRVRRLQQEVLEPEIAAKSGRLVKAMGDGFLAEFASVVDATACAIEIQGKMAAHEDGSPGEEPLRLRIGVHVGDVLVEGDDLLGDGVNVAARIEAAAEAVRTAIGERPSATWAWRIVAAAYANLDRMDEARSAYQRLITAEPGTTLSAVARGSTPSAASPRYKAALVGGLRKLGMPE